MSTFDPPIYKHPGSLYNKSGTSVSDLEESLLIPASKTFIGFDYANPDKPLKNDVNIVDNFEATIGKTRVVLKNVPKELIETIVKALMNKETPEKPKEYVED
ncbi:MAG: hypothetical protein ACP5N7_04300 [Candidatus Pacearchaeota archaeon]